MTHPIYMLWALPRTTSTAFEWMMRMRGDMSCFHEPFGVAWYQGDDAMAPRLTADSPRSPGVTFATVLADLDAAAERRAVFAKDMPQFSSHLWSPDFLARFHHSFLIRDPAKIMTSLHRSYQKPGAGGEFTDKEIGFEDQRRLFDLLSDRDGEPPPVLDSDDLLDDPPAMVRRFCDSVGIDFIPEALRWEPGDRSEVLWYDRDDSTWHETLKSSDGLRAQPRSHADVSELPERLRRQCEAMLPHYEHLHAHRL